MTHEPGVRLNSRPRSVGRSAHETVGLEIARGSVFVHDTGRGPTALLLHGNPDSSDMWRGVIARVDDKFRCVAPDLPGWGRSTAPEHRDWRLVALGNFVAELIAGLQLDRPIHLVVHDIGAFYGLPWAMEHAEDVASVIIINAPFSSSYRWHYWARVWRTPGLGEACMRLMNRRLFCWVLNRASPGLPPTHAHNAYSLFKPTVRSTVLELYRAVDAQTFQAWETRMADLARTVPVDVLWGDRDPYVAPKFASGFGTARVHHFPRYGHWLPVEAPEVVAACLHARLAMVEGDGG